MRENLLNVKVKYIKIKSINLKEIGEAKAKYDLERGKLSVDDLSDIGSSNANLDNNETPININNGTFYHLSSKFEIQGTYLDGLYFTVSIVSADKNNPFREEIYNKTIFIDKEGEQSLEGDILIPPYIKEGKYFLTVKLTNNELDKLTKNKKTIKDIPQIGATYVYINHKDKDRTTTVLDINTTKYMDIPYKKYDNILFTSTNFLQQESGKGRFLFSNIGEEDINVSISATLELSNGDVIDLGILNPNNKKIENSVILTIPHYSRKNAQLFFENRYNITIPTNHNFQSISKQRTNPEITDSRVSQQISNLTYIHRVFIPYATKSSIGEKRYRATLSFYIPKNEYNRILNVAPDLSQNVNIHALDGEVKWKILFFDKQTMDELTNSIDLIKFNDQTNDDSSGFITVNRRSLIAENIHPIDASLEVLDGTTYVFSGTKCAKCDKNTGKVIGEWKKTTEVFSQDSFFQNPINASFRSANIAYFFIKDGKEYFAYDLRNKKVLYSGNTKEFKLRVLFDLEFPPECIDKYLKTDSIDAAFLNKTGIYFIAGNRFVKYSIFDESQKYGKLNCYDGGLLSKKDEWQSIANKDITAVLSTNKNKSDKLIFFINGFESQVVLGKPNLFLDKHNGLFQELGDSDIVSIRFNANYGLNSWWYVPHARAYANANLDFYLFSYKSSLISVEADAYGAIKKINPLSSKEQVTIKSGAKLKLYILGSKYVDEDSIRDITITAKFNNNSQNKSDYINNKILYENNIANWDEKKTIFDSRFPVGPIMLSVSGGIKGTVKLQSPIDLSEEEISAILSVKPSISSEVSVFAEGGVNYEFIKAGVLSDVVLTNAGTSGNLNASLGDKKNNIEFKVGTKADGDFNLLKAKFKFYVATRTSIKWCSAWGVPYPCGLDWSSWEIPIYSTPWLYSNELIFFSKELANENVPLY
jgi:hypothetical protein